MKCQRTDTESHLKRLVLLNLVLISVGCIILLLSFPFVSANYASMGMWRDSPWRIPPIGFFLSRSDGLDHAKGASTRFIVASGRVLSERYGHGGPGVCLGDSQTEAEGVLLQGGCSGVYPHTWPDLFPIVASSRLHLRISIVPASALSYDLSTAARKLWLHTRWARACVQNPPSSSSLVTIKHRGVSRIQPFTVESAYKRFYKSHIYSRVALQRSLITTYPPL